MSLLNAACCCCNNTAPNCACLASSITVDIPAWSYGSYSCPAQTIIAYKCCYTISSASYFTYRASAINIGTTYSTRSGCSTLNLNTYFVFFIQYQNSFFINFCNIFIGAYIVTEDSFQQGSAPFTCYPCVNTPLVIDSSTACYGITTNNLCSYTNTFEAKIFPSYFSTATSCAHFLPTLCPAQMQQVTSSIRRAKTNTNCSKINSFPVKFGTTDFTMTIS